MFGFAGLVANADPVVRLSPDSRKVGWPEVRYVLKVETDGEWEAEVDADWISVSPAGQTGTRILEVAVQSNSTNATRTGTISVGGVEHVLTQVPRGSALRELKAMGSDGSGQLGALRIRSRDHPVQIRSEGVKYVAAGLLHTLFIDEDNVLWAFGFNEDGRLGDGTTIDRGTPIRVAENVAMVMPGAYHTLFLTLDGELWGMGANYYNALSDDTEVTQITPVLVADDVIDAAAGWYFTLFIKSDGSLWAMGYNQYGGLGDGTGVAKANPVEIAQDVVSVAAGGAHSIFLKSDGTVWTAGQGAYGKLGDGTFQNQFSPVQVAEGAKSVAAGRDHSFWITVDGSLWATGWNNYGQLGDGSTVIPSIPIEVGNGVTAVSSFLNHTLILKVDGSLLGVGDNRHGQLGEGGDVSPTFVELATDVIGLATGAQQSYFVKENGSLWAMGSNESGSLGDGTRLRREQAIQVAAGVEKIAAGFNSSHFIDTDGTLWSFGYSSHDPIHFDTSSSVPERIADAVAQVVTGGGSRLFLDGMGQVWASGTSQRHALGVEGSFHNLEPGITVSDVASMATSGSHSLFLMRDGTLWAAGANYYGQLGDGTSTDKVTPVHIADEVVSIATGDFHSLFLKQDGSMWGMGNNVDGKLGDGTRQNKSSPIRIATEVAMIAAGSNHSLFLKRDGTLWGMGINRVGQLSPDRFGWYLSPVKVDENVSAVFAGEHRTLYLKGTGTLWQRGGDHSNESLFNQSEEMRAAHILSDRAVAAAAGDEHVLWIESDLPSVAWAQVNSTASAGGSLHMTVGTVSGNDTRFQWQESLDHGVTWQDLPNDARTSGTQTRALDIRSLTKLDDGRLLRFVVSDGRGAYAYDIAPLDVRFAPQVTRQPKPVTKLPGGNVELDAGVEANPSPLFQWRKDGVDLPGATSATLSLFDVQPEDAGAYSVLISNDLGSVETTVAQVGVPVFSALHQVARGYRNGGHVAVRNALAWGSGEVSSITWSVLIPTEAESSGWSWLQDSLNQRDDVIFVQSEGLLEWKWSNPAGAEAWFSFALSVPAEFAASPSLSSFIEVTVGEEVVELMAAPEPLQLQPAPDHHTADLNQDYQIDLSELLRVIEIYNTRYGSVRTGRYTTDSASLDGVKPAPTINDQTPAVVFAFHAADMDFDGRINLSELLHVIEFYNQRDGSIRSGRYHLDVASPDGFSSGPGMD